MQTSIIKPIIIAFKIAPIPGFCFKGNHNSKTTMLTNIVIIPVEKSTFNAIPCARTDQGEAPAKETINNPSPKPNKVNPRHKKKKVEIDRAIHGSLLYVLEEGEPVDIEGQPLVGTDD